MRSLTFLMSVIFALNIFAQSYTEIGSGTVSTSYPVYSVWNYGWYSFILPQTDVGASKTITQIAFNCNNGPKTCANQKIYMAHTSQSIFGSAAYDNPSSYTLVYDGTINYNGWTIVTLSTPFVYNGTDNLLIQYENRAGSSNYANFNSSASVSNNNKSGGNDASFPTGAGNLNPYPNSIPNVRLYFPSSAPATPVCLSPSDNAEKVDLNTNLSFNLGANTTSYDLYFSTDSALVASKDAGVKVVSDAVVSSAGNFNYSPSSLLVPATKYYWRVVAKDGATITESVVWRFKAQNVIQNFPYSQGFEDNEVIYTGFYGMYTDWSYPTTGNEMIWFKSGPDNAHTGNAALYAGPSSSVSTNNSSMVSPRIFLPANYRISFYWRNGDVTKISGVDTTFFEITTNGGSSWNTLGYLSPTSVQTTFVFAQFDLSAYAGNNVYMRWRYKKVSVAGKYSYIDDILIEPIPSGAVMSLNSNTVSFNPIAINAHTHKTVTITNTGTQNLIISGVNVDAPYSASMSETILPGDSAHLQITFNGSTSGSHNASLIINSNGTGVNTISLSGSVVELGNSFLETFEGVAAGSLPSGWGKLRSEDPFQSLNDIMVKNSSFDAFSAPNVVRMYNNSDTISPLILLTNGLTDFNTNTLKFYASKTQGNTANVELTVGLMDDPYDATSFDSIQQIVLSETMTQYVFNFNASNTKPYIAFRHGQKKQMQSIWIDDVQWESATASVPNCAGIVAPAQASVNNEIELLLKWTSTGGSPTGYKMYFGTNNPPTNIINGTDLGDTLSHLVSGLNYSTTYYWKVVAYNAIGDSSSCDVWSFTTMDDPTLFVPWSQNFDALTNTSGFNYPLGWSIINNGDQFNCWDLIVNSTTSPNNAHSGSNAMHMSFSFLNPLNDYLVTAPVQLYNGTDYKLSFWMKAPIYVEGNDTTKEKLEVVFGTGKTSAELTNRLWIDSNLRVLDYQYIEIPFNVASDGKYYFSWRAWSDPLQWLMMIDDVSMTIDNAIDENNEPGFVVFPNPVSDFLNISLKESFSSQTMVEIFNAQGQLVNSIIIENKNVSISTANLQQGVYYIKLSGESQGRPFIKQ